MKNGFYISRTLLGDDATSLTELELFQDSGIVVILAEPGAGKSRLLEIVASRLGTAVQKASVFRNKTTVESEQTLILDALDEVARNDGLAIDEILVRAEETGARTVLLASRSSEWDDSRTVFIKECFKTEPGVFRLMPLNSVEQDFFIQKRNTKIQRRTSLG